MPELSERDFVVFSVDGASYNEPGGRCRLRKVPQAWRVRRAFEKFCAVKGVQVRPGLGRYDGVNEECWACSAKDFDEYILNSGWFRNQFAYMYVPYNLMQDVTIREAKTGRAIRQGTLTELLGVSENEDYWMTYGTQRYFTLT